MLFSLHIENIALIKNIDIEFGPGLNVLTGETGAGKSILIDSIALLCGARADRDIIRTGEEMAVVEGVFGFLSEESLAFLAKLEIVPDEDGNIFLYRMLSADGRGTAKINARQVSVSRLREAASVLLAVHGQQDTQTLADEKTQLSMLDTFCGSAPYVDAYTKEYKKYKEISSAKEKLYTDEDEKAFRAQMIDFSLSEIEKAKLSSEEEDALNAERTLLRNSEKILINASLARDALYSGQANVCDLAEKAAEAISRLKGIIAGAGELAARAESIGIEAADIAGELSAYLDNEEADPVQRLDIIEERLAFISSMKRKYKTDVAGILAKYKELVTEREQISNADEVKARLEQEEKKQLAVLTDAAAALTAVRQFGAKSLGESVEKTLSFLDMPSVRFSAHLEQKEFASDGADIVSFMISANKGEEEKAISRIASGGELSRIMLALKSISAETGSGTMIFDEIDAGISGSTSDKIGMKLLELSKGKYSQVICVTHSAQIASRSDMHLLISKSEIDGRIHTAVASLDENGRVDELSRIIGGVEITESVRTAAKDMLNRV